MSASRETSAPRPGSRWSSHPRDEWASFRPRLYPPQNKHVSVSSSDLSRTPCNPSEGVVGLVGGSWAVGCKPRLTGFDGQDQTRPDQTRPPGACRGGISARRSGEGRSNISLGHLGFSAFAGFSLPFLCVFSRKGRRRHLAARAVCILSLPFRRRCGRPFMLSHKDQDKLSAADPLDYGVDLTYW